MTGMLSFTSTAVADYSNPTSRWQGFNVLYYFGSMPPKRKSSAATTEDDFRWMSGRGSDFGHIPIINAPNTNFELTNKVTPGRCTERQ